MSKLKKIIIFLSSLAIMIPLCTFGYFYIQMNSMYESEESSDEIEGLIKEDDTENTVLLDDNITNILLIGSDGRTLNERGRSDAMMIATIDEKHKKIKLTSLARDTYVKIPGKGYEKLNHAYSYGGATLLMETIENNFGVGITSYVNVNFASFIDIIDALGGITINVKSSELSELNKYIPECYEASNNKKKSKLELIKKSGTQVLNGYQALSYSRIRKNDSAFERDGRQRQVLQALLNEASTMSFREVTKVSNALFPYVKTNIKPLDIMKYVSKVLKINNFNIEQLEFPIAEYSKGGIVKNKGWVLQFNYSKCLPILHRFIFEEEIEYSYINNKYEDYSSSDSDLTLEDKKELSNSIENSTNDNQNSNNDDKNDTNNDSNTDKDESLDSDNLDNNSSSNDSNNSNDNNSDNKNENNNDINDNDENNSDNNNSNNNTSEIPDLEDNNENVENSNHDPII